MEMLTIGEKMLKYCIFHKYKFLFWKEKRLKKIYTIVSAAADYRLNK